MCTETRNILFSDARLFRIESRPQSLKHVRGTAHSKEAPNGDSRQYSKARLMCTLIGGSDLSGLPHLSNRCGLACHPDDWDHWAFVIGSMQEESQCFRSFGSVSVPDYSLQCQWMMIDMYCVFTKEEDGYVVCMYGMFEAFSFWQRSRHACSG